MKRIKLDRYWNMEVCLRMRRDHRNSSYHEFSENLGISKGDFLTGKVEDDRLVLRKVAKVGKQLDQSSIIWEEGYFRSLWARRLRDEALEEADDLQLAIECDRELSEQHIEEE
jgi:bifunctional DNA-binding transcriptional regulator/antitoxin component of YhaV-PrlF toxin-antitoxin module